MENADQRCRKCLNQCIFKQNMEVKSHQKLAGLTVSAIGIVFGDIGTSPCMQ